MSDSTTNGPTVQDLLLRIMQQQDAGFLEIRQSQAKIVDSVNRIDRDVALLQLTGEQMKAIPSRVQSLETSRDMLARQLAESDRYRIDYGDRLGELEETSSVRKGWEGFGGKILYLIGGAGIASIVGLIFAMLQK